MNNIMEKRAFVEGYLFGKAAADEEESGGIVSPGLEVAGGGYLGYKGLKNALKDVSIDQTSKSLGRNMKVEAVKNFFRRVGGAIANPGRTFREITANPTSADFYAPHIRNAKAKAKGNIKAFDKAVSKNVLGKIKPSSAIAGLLGLGLAADGLRRYSK